MNKKYNLKLDLQFRCNNSTMKFDEFDNNTSDFFIRVTRAGELIDISKAIVTLVVIKPDNSVDAQFVDIDSNRAYCDLKPTMKNLVGKYEAIASITVDGETVNTGIDNPIIYEVTENKFLRQLNQKVVTEERFTLLTDMINRLSTIEISEEQRVINEAERILSEENRKIEEAKRVEAELIRQHEEADRAKYDATRESNENIRKQNESTRLANETNRIDEEAKRVEEETNRVKAEQLRKDNYNFMTEDEDRRRSEANSHKEAEKLRAQAENTRVNEEAKRRTTEQARVSAENTRVSNENTRKDNEATRQTNETKRVEAETQRQNRYNSFIADAEINANNFENYTNSAKIKEEERKSNELDRKSQEDRRVSNEVERISNENTRKANEAVREKNETSRQNTFANKVNEVDKKIIELNTTKDNFVSSISTKVDNKISELDSAKSDMTTTVSNKVNEVETRFNALTSSQQQDAEVKDARVDFKGVAFDSLKERIDYTDKLLRDSTVSTIETESDFTTVEATSNGYFEDVKLEGKTLVNLWDINSIGKSGETVVKNNRITVTTTSNIYSNFFYEQKSKFKPSTEYTIIVDVYKNTLQSNDNVFITSNSGKAPASRDIFAINGGTQFIIKGGTVGRFVRKRTTISDFSETDFSLRSFVANNSQTEGGELELVITVLEGDHTQNPPSYFEGLKSVGQSATTSEDEVDEIVVESVNENLIPNIKFKKGGTDTPPYNNLALDNTRYRSLGDFIFLPKGEYYINSNQSVSSQSIAFKVKDMFGKDIIGVTDTPFTFNNPINQYVYIFGRKGGGEWDLGEYPSDIGLTLTKGKDLNSYTLHQSDKKRLLYYNEETQTWEKPVLREWDSIEKHANGKYYYHQRSAEVVLNGSENWNNDTNSSTMSPATYRQSIQFDAIDIPSASFNTKTSPNIISDLLPTVIFGDVYSYNRIGISISGTDSIGTHIIINNNFINITELKQWLQANNLTVVYQLAEEKVYECTNIDLITYNGETNFIVNSGALSPKTTLKVHSNISNVVSLLQKKVSLLESNVTSYMITQNRLMLASRYNSDAVSFKVDYAVCSENMSQENYDTDLYNLILNNILVGKDNYDYNHMFNIIMDYASWSQISWDQFDILVGLMDIQHNPPIEEIPTDDEIVEEIPNEIM